MIFGIKGKSINLTRWPVGYCYEYTHATYDVLCPRVTYVFSEFKSQPYSYLSNFLFIFIAGMMKAVSLAVDLIMAHFNSRQDPEEKVVTRSQFFFK